jgi:predicted aminopeptidase
MEYINEILAAGLRAAGVTPEQADAQAQAIVSKVWKEYEALGEPNGPGLAGMMRWLDEQAPVANAA